MDDLSPECRPPFLLRLPDVQTVCAGLRAYAAPPPNEPLRAALRDGRGDLLLHASWRDDARRPAVLILHGLGGTSQSPYVVRAALAALAHGCHAVRMNARGVGAGLAHARGLPHAGLSDDVTAAVDTIASDARVSGVHLLGFSIGGHMALRAAADWGDRPPAAVRTVVAVSAPLSLAPASHHMEGWRVTPYRRHVLRGLTRALAGHLALHADAFPQSAAHALTARTIRAYDEAVTAPHHGFADADAYYAEASVAPVLSRVRAPTLYLHAMDDPMVGRDAIFPHIAHATAAVRVRFTARGGHVGFVESLAPDGFVRTWAMRHALAFMEAQ